MLKAYFIPTFKAEELGIPTMVLITKAIQGLSESSKLGFPSLGILPRFLVTSEGSALKAEILAIDCIDPAESRLKIYMRTQSTSFSSVREIMTLGGLLDDSILDHNLEELRTLWNLVFSQADDPAQDVELPPKDHRTAGILYYSVSRDKNLIQESKCTSRCDTTALATSPSRRD